MEEKNARIQLDDEMVEEVSGGLLSLKNVDGQYVVQVRDADFNVVYSYPVKKGVRKVNSLLQEMYWTFEEGHRDNQMIAYLQQNGYI